MEKVAGRTGGSLGSGGMYTKVLAARTAAKTSTNTIIASGKTDDVLVRLHTGEVIGTLIEY